MKGKTLEEEADLERMSVAEVEGAIEQLEVKIKEAHKMLRSTMVQTSRDKIRSILYSLEEELKALKKKIK